MKKLLLLFFAVAAVALLPGCPKNVDYAYWTKYVYVNECSSDITIHAFEAPNNFDGSKGEPVDHSFVVPTNGEYTVRFVGRGYRYPLIWEGSTNEDFVTISNGTKTVTQRRKNNDLLYAPDNYTLISEKDRVKTLEFVFTDKFFENGEPIK